MGILEAIILGIIQGLTEFLPVSSSGHLELAKAIMGEQMDADQGLLFTIVVHAATAFSTIVIFRKDIVEILRGLIAFKWNDELKFSLKIILSMIPAGLIGLFFEKEIDGFFNGRIVLVGILLILTGLLLYLADKAQNTARDVSFSKALIIGISQAIAILPGISRSGATISTSVLLGIDRTRAARFSFLMVVPLILGAMTMKTKDYIDLQSFNEKSTLGRTEIILSELSENALLSDDEKARLQPIIYHKEEAWAELKEENFGNEKDLRSAKELLQMTYSHALAKENISQKTTQLILENHYSKVRGMTDPDILVLLIGFLAAFLTGLFACQWMIALVRRAKLVYFSVYCAVVGVIAIGLSLF